MNQSGDMVGKLKEKGYRLTPQRLVVLSAIEDSEDHISADEIYAQVVARYPYVNISTVYRTLELLKQLGLVNEMVLGDRLRYHPVDKGHHHHLVCKECGAITELDESMLSSLKSNLLHEYKFVADLKHLAISGRCGKCAE